MTFVFPARRPSVDTLEPRRLLSFVPFGSETPVEMPSGGSVSQIDSAVARDGSYIVAGVVDFGTSTMLTATRYSADGRTIGNQIFLGQLQPPTQARFSSVNVATDADGDSVIAYSIFKQQTSTESLHFVRVSRDGSVSAPRFLTEGNASNPTVTMADNGRFFVGWSTSELRDTFVRIAAFNQNGAPLAPRFTAAHNQGLLPSQILNLSLSATSDGSSAAFAYTFFDDSDSGGLTDVFHGRVTANGVFFSASGLSVDHTRSASVAMNEDGSYYLGYEQLPVVNFEPDYDLAETSVQKFDVNGNATGPLMPIRLGHADEVHLAGLTAISDGGFAVALHEGIGADTKLYTHRFFPNAISDGPDPILLAQSQPGNEIVWNSIGIAADQNGTALISYRRQGDINPFFGTALYRRVSAQPAAIDKGVLYLLGTDVEESFDVRPRGQSIVVTYENFLNPGVQEVRRYNPALITSISSSLGNGDDLLFNRTALPSTIDGGNGDDLIVGGSSRDRITGGLSDDSIYGGDGDDLLYGQDSEDFLFGGNGNDSLNGGGGLDILRGEAGNDFLASDDGIRDILIGHGGRDTADADGLDLLREIESTQ